MERRRFKFESKNMDNGTQYNRLTQFTIPPIKFSFVERYFLVKSLIFVYLLTEFTLTNSKQIQPSSITEFYFDEANFLPPDSVEPQLLSTSSLQQPTPPLNPNLLPRPMPQSDRTKSTKTIPMIISPSKLYRRYANHEPDAEVFSPIFQSQYMAKYNNFNFYPENSVDSGNIFDLVEPGSGMEPSSWEENTNTMPIEDTSTTTDTDTPSAISPTPMFNDFSLPNTPTGPTTTSNDNKPPVLNKRLPKLALTAGRVWRYFIPSDTFIDEDGDLTKLKTSVSAKKVYTDNMIIGNSMTGNGSQSNNYNDYYLWLQYDPSSLLLYGLSTENEAGKHEFVFTVTDRFGLISEEIIEINVRQHQSTRAFTHLFVIDKIEWTKQRFPSMVDAIGEFVKRISTLVYLEQPFRNLIVQNYIINDNDRQLSNSIEQTTNSNLSFSLAWSNSSMPIYPCNVSQIEDITRHLINQQILNYDWNLGGDNRVNLVPSPSLIKALAPDFVPMSVSIYLQGTCSDKEQSKINNNLGSIMMVKNKIGQLNWRLGEIIEFKIPEDTFSLGGDSIKNSELSLSVHTIDGVDLDKDIFFDFLEFHQDSQTVYGIPYDLDTHTGQRELILTATHKASEQITREVFIINVEPQDLTTFNNRAFKMSLYFNSRTISFGPKERVHLAHKMVGGLKTTKYPLNRELKNQEMIVISIQKFLKNYSLSEGNKINLNYQERFIKVSDTAMNQYNVDQQYSNSNEQSYLYKFTWTNSSIGYKGDCPVEVISQDILGALKNSMEVFHQSSNSLSLNYDKPNSSELLHLYFQPEIDLILLRFEPIGACLDALKSYDVGSSTDADDIDRVENSEFIEEIQELSTISILTSTTPMMDLDADNDVYWSIVLLLILVVAVIYTIITLALGLHTFFINQDKKHRFQVGLAQARQSSMFLSNMILTNQANAFDLNAQMLPNNSNKTPFIDEDKVSRKPVILDNERGLLTTMIPTAVQITSGNIQTTPIKHSYSTLGSGITWRPEMSLQSMQPTIFENQQSMTLNRRPIGYIQQYSHPNQPTTMNHSQSILTVGSLANHLTMIPHGQVPIAYSQIPIVATGPSLDQSQLDYSTLQNRLNKQRTSLVANANVSPNTNQIPYTTTYESNDGEQINLSNKSYTSKNQISNGVNRLNSYNNRSSSYSSSTSATNQSIISVSNVGRQRSEV